jgi:hypothetical protein
MSETIVVPDNSGNNNMNNAWPWMFAGNNGFGGFGGGNFWGAGIGAFLGSALGNWFGGNGNGLGGNGGAAAASLGAQATANQNTELLRAAISSNGEQSRQAIQTVSTMLGQDFATVSAQFGAINGILNNMAVQNATTPLQIINAIVGGNKDLQAEFANCCCQNKLLVTEQGYQAQLRTLEQTAAMNNGFAGVNTNIAATKAAQELSDCKQTYALTDTMNRNFIAIDNKLDAMESQRKDREITALTAKVAQLESQGFTTAALGQAVAPINAQLAALAREVDDIKCKQPSTVSVQYPNLVAVNATPYVSGGFYQNGYNGNGWWGNGWGNNVVF